MTVTTPTKRTAGGQFAVGNPGGPGRPPRPVERDYLRALTERCPPDVWGEICQKAVEDARQGDAQARAWLSRYLLGGKTASDGLSNRERDEAMMADLLG